MDEARKSPRNATVSLDKDGNPQIPDLGSVVREATTSIRPRKATRGVDRKSPRDAIARPDRGSFTMKDEVTKTKTDGSPSPSRSRSNERVIRNTRPSIEPLKKKSESLSPSTTTTSKSPSPSTTTTTSKSPSPSTTTTTSKSPSPSTTASKSPSTTTTATTTSKSPSLSPSTTTATASSPSKSKSKPTVVVPTPTAASPSRSRSGKEDQVPRHTSSKDTIEARELKINRSRSVRKSYTGDTTIPTSNTILKTYLEETHTSNRKDAKVKPSTAKKFKEQNVKYYCPDFNKIQVPKGKKLITTDEGNFIVPKFDKMTPEEAQRARIFLEMNIAKMNENWKNQGHKFESMAPGESLENGEIRYQLYCRFVSSRTGCDLYKMMLFGMWAFTEAALCYMGVPASGYFQSQLMMFDIYERKLIEMGQSSGFGKDWSPITTLLVYSVINAAILIFFNKMAPDGKGGSKVATGPVMRKIASTISGQPTVSLDSDGVMKPTPPPDPLGDSAKDMGFGDISSLIGMMGKGDLSSMMGGMMSMFSGGLGGGAEEETTVKKKKRTPPSHKS